MIGIKLTNSIKGLCATIANEGGVANPWGRTNLHNIFFMPAASIAPALRAWFAVWVYSHLIYSGLSFLRGHIWLCVHFFSIISVSVYFPSGDGVMAPLREEWLVFCRPHRGWFFRKLTPTLTLYWHIQVPFHLWWKETMPKHGKVSKYFV